jgi:hypothetical protein
MFDGNRFFPLTGTPMSNKDWSRIRLADCEPVPLAVAMLIVKSLMTRSMSKQPWGVRAFAVLIGWGSQAPFQHVANAFPDFPFVVDCVERLWS